ncbi:hypothetical protein LSCM4_00077 [Leishmania orientalis]|uniref:Uncharacterized protein n=1 Tax=Leishmania orientalis TaxID=2249476 RepID=A0A836FL61_9TRYP|nr:hypothetical protein LSCM4_00077 [Leishmania orientalis]
MSADSNSFSTYIDHLILLLAARFHAPLNVSVEDPLPSGVNAPAESQSPWELVARAVQQALRAPQTEQERRLVRQLDVHLFSASVCRERARYMQWKLQEIPRLRGDQQQLSPSSRMLAADAANKSSAVAASPTAAGQPYDVTRRSLHEEVRSLYALVRQSLPSTLGDTESGDEGDAQAPASLVQSAAPASEPSVFASVREVFVRTPAERERDEQVARARDEFLSEVQALQSAYYDKYRRWMDVPESILDPPPYARKQLANANGAASAPESDSGSQRAASREALGAAAPLSLHLTAQANRINGSAAADGSERLDTLASVFRQIQLQRPLRPSAVPDDLLERMYCVHAESEEGLENRSSASDWRSSVLSAFTSMPPSLAGASADTIVAGAVSAAPPSPQPPSSAAAARKDTAPPASRRGRWQIVEYDDDDNE